MTRWKSYMCSRASVKACEDTGILKWIMEGTQKSLSWTFEWMWFNTVLTVRTNAPMWNRTDFTRDRGGVGVK